jgi:hypothetical protein
VVELIEQSRLCHFTLRQTARRRKRMQGLSPTGTVLRACSASAVSFIGLTALIVTHRIGLPTSYALSRDTRVMLHLKSPGRTPE